MALDILAILSAAGTGAVTGYLTNNLALKMIFKEYGPLGGVVIKTKEEFIDSISELVERDIINHHTLEEEFSRPEFKKKFTQSVDDFLNIYLEQRSSEIKLADLPAWEDNFELLTSFSAEAAVEILAGSSNKLKGNELKEIISESEQEKLLREAYSKIIKRAEAEASIENLILAFYEQLKEKSLKRLLNPETQCQIKDFLTEAVNYFRNNYQSLESAEKEEFKEKLKELFDLENLSQNIINEIKEVKISDIFKEKNELKQIIEESKLHEILKEILVNLKIEVDNSELLLDDFFTNELEESLEEEAAELIYSAESELIKFLEAEKDELNNLILNSVEAEIEASTGFKAMSRQGIYNKYTENIEEYGLPLTYLKDYLKEKISSDNGELAAAVIGKVEEIEVKKILQKLELDEIADRLESLLWDFYQQNEDKKLIELFSEEIFAQEVLSEKIIELLFASIKNISSEAESIDILIDYLLEFNLGELIKREKIVSKIENNAAEIYQLLAENKFFSKKGAEYLNQNFFQLLNVELNNNGSEFKAGAKNYLSQLETTLGNKKLNLFYNLIKDKPEAVADLTESISAFFYNNLPELLEGKVAQAASTNLHQLSDQEVQAAIEDFMGKELKPITYLGALLGAAAGIIFSLSGAEAALFNVSPVWVNYLSSALLYGGVGWLTNVLAIWMIFHPYQEKNFMGVKIPFTPGVVAKNRSRFADSMGKFVEKELLKANSASEIIEKNRSEIKNRALEYFEAIDYQQFFKLLASKNDILAESAVEKIQEILMELELDQFKTLIEPLNLKLNKLLAEKAENIDFAAEIEKYLSQKENLPAEFDSLISSKLSVEKITAAAAGEYKLELDSKQIKNFLQNKELYPLFKFLAPYLLEKEFNFDFKNYLLELLREDTDYYLDQSLAMIFQQQEKIARIINFKKDEIIEKEKDKKGGMLKNTLISGAIYMADLDEFIDSVVERVFQQLRENYFVDNRNQLEELYNNLLEQLENKELFAKEELKINKILKNFLTTESGAELLTEVLYLSEDPLNELIDSAVKFENKKLLSLDLELKAEAVEYFINQQLNLEQKLKLLLLVKKIFAADNIEKEIMTLLKESDLKILNQELEKLLKGKQLFELKDIEPELFEGIKKNLASLLKNQELNDLLVSKSSAEIKKLSQLLEAEMDRGSLEYLLTLFVEAGVDSFKANSEDLLDSLELKELTASEVRKMNPAEIEAVFDSFAGKYFSHLKQYGWFGGIFGMLQLLLRTII